ncbi:hypothetical protein K2X85_11995 [bacterium]|nr:hypothetical protein [bacterium]
MKHINQKSLDPKGEVNGTHGDYPRSCVELQVHIPYFRCRKCKRTVPHPKADRDVIGEMKYSRAYVMEALRLLDVADQKQKQVAKAKEKILESLQQRDKAKGWRPRRKLSKDDLRVAGSTRIDELGLGDEPGLVSGMTLAQLQQEAKQVFVAKQLEERHHWTISPSVLFHWWAHQERLREPTPKKSRKSSLHPGRI